jgi:hypothetical protein
VPGGRTSEVEFDARRDAILRTLMGVLLELDPRTVSAIPGQPATIQVRARNSGTVVDQFTFEVLGDAGAWSKVEPPTLSLFPGAEGSATITFAPPRSPNVRAGSIPFGLRARSNEDPAGSTVEEGSVEVGAFSDVFTELVPHTSRGSRGAAHDLALDNRGNVPVNAVLTAVDADRLLDFDVRPPSVVAEPGTASFAKVRVKPRKTFWRGPAVTRPFQVQAEIPDQAPLTVDGSLLQTPILPPGTLRALAALAAVLVIAAVAWFTLLRPAIESTARQQAQDVLAAVGITPPPSGAAGGGGGAGASPSAATSAAPSPSAAATPTPAPTPPPTSAAVSVGTPTDGRLTAGKTLSPPAGMTLYLTDLVFNNPSDTATGQIRLERSGQALLVLQLQNFRNLDYHFVTPIVTADSQQLKLVCPDPGGCPGASLYYSGYQR